MTVSEPSHCALALPSGRNGACRTLRIGSMPSVSLETRVRTTLFLVNPVSTSTVSQRPVILGIAGCSGSGKTTLARELANVLDATLFPLDLYYRDLSQFPLDLRDKQNFDHPDSLESELFIEHVRDLADGITIERPVYDFKIHSRVPNTFDPIAPKKFVIVEGILALHYDELAALFDFSVYVDAPNAICLNRRIYRDMRERGRTEESVRAQFAATAQPMADLYVLPSQARATLTVHGTDNLDWSIEQVLRGLRNRGLL
ncbi:MAG TPA: uridine kinase [Acidobacteriaceae bacterium]